MKPALRWDTRGGSVQVCNPSTGEVEAKGSKVQSDPWLPGKGGHSGLQGPCLTKKAAVPSLWSPFLGLGNTNTAHNSLPESRLSLLPSFFRQEEAGHPGRWAWSHSSPARASSEARSTEPSLHLHPHLPNCPFSILSLPFLKLSCLRPRVLGIPR